jgi:hypothetical protein
MSARSWVLVVVLLAIASPALATTAPDVRSRIAIDGSTADFDADEAVFGVTALGNPEESDSDSQWGFTNDISQVRITWDHRSLYLAGEGMIWDNNMILFLDLFDGRGLADLFSLNSWRRNVAFPSDFAPDVFSGTWDGNTAPRLLIHLSGSQVSDNLPGALFAASATFFHDEAGRAMELRIPWTTLFSAIPEALVRDTVIAGDTLSVLPVGLTLRVAGMVSAGADGSGGPDSAPNNTGGHSPDYLALVFLDNFASLVVDEDGDGFADDGASPRARVQFRHQATPAEAASWGSVKARYR